MKSKDLVKKNETAIIIFTDGRDLKMSDNGQGETGVWRIKKNLQVDKVILYKRVLPSDENEVYVGDFVRLSQSKLKEHPKRKVVEFESLKYIGKTEANWLEFTETKQGAVSPIKYIR